METLVKLCSGDAFIYHEKHTEFLRQCVLHDEGARRQELVENISQLQHDMRCVRRAVWLMAILTELIMAGLGYGIILGFFGLFSG